MNKLYPKDIASLIEVRNFLAGSVENLNIKLSREDLKNVQTRIKYLDQVILDAALTFDVADMGMYDFSKTAPSTKVVKEFVRESTEDTAKVMDKYATKAVVDSAGTVSIKAPEGEDK